MVGEEGENREEWKVEKKNRRTEEELSLRDQG